MADAARVTVVGDAMEAEAACGLLRANGIECEYRRAEGGVGSWDPTAQAGPREILVAPGDLEAARALLEPPG